MDDDDDDLAAYVATATCSPPPHPLLEAEPSAQAEYALQPRRLHQVEAATPSHTGDGTPRTPRRCKKPSASAKKTPTKTTPRRGRAARVQPPAQVSAICLADDRLGPSRPVPPFTVHRPAPNCPICTLTVHEARVCGHAGGRSAPSRHTNPSSSSTTPHAGSHLTGAKLRPGRVCSHGACRHHQA